MALLMRCAAGIVVGVTQTLLATGHFRVIHGTLSSLRALGSRRGSVEEWLRATDAVCRACFRSDYCLARAAALTAILRLRGVPAVFVLGLRRFPFSAHAWVEVDGLAIGEDPELVMGYTVIERLISPGWPAGGRREDATC